MNKEKLILYVNARSSCSWRVRFALDYKGCKYEIREVTPEILQTKEYRTLNPQGKIPTLVIGKKTITQSLAILEYLDEIYPEFPILPKNINQRADARTIALMIGSDIQPYQNLSCLDMIPEKNHQIWLNRWLYQGLIALESKIKTTSGKYCVGDTITIADFFLVPQLRNARLFKIPLDQFPTLLQIEKTLFKNQTFSLLSDTNMEYSKLGIPE